MTSGEILVTGASGFIGRALVEALGRRRVPVRGSVRRSAGDSPIRLFATGDLESGGNWADAVDGVSCIVHLAGRAHVLQKSDAEAEKTAFYQVNVEASRRLGLAAAKANVRRLVFVSSVGVLGAVTRGWSFDDNSPAEPAEPYAVSKLRAEQVLREVAETSGLELVIVRPPMVYGPGSPGNLQRLMQLIGRGIPLPKPMPANRRSLVHIDNLVEFLQVCAEHPRAAGESFVVADEEAVSTGEIVSLLARGMGKRPRFIPVPAALLSAAAKALGQGRMYEKVYGSLEVDSGRARCLLGWEPKRSIREGLLETGKAFSKIS